MWVATTTGLPRRRLNFTIRRWIIGSSSIGTLNSQIAPRDHHRIRRLDDFVNRMHRRLILDLGHDQRFAFLFRQKAAQFPQVLFLPDKT